MTFIVVAILTILVVYLVMRTDMHDSKISGLEMQLRELTEELRSTRRGPLLALLAAVGAFASGCDTPPDGPMAPTDEYPGLEGTWDDASITSGCTKTWIFTAIGPDRGTYLFANGCELGGAWDSTVSARGEKGDYTFADDRLTLRPSTSTCPSQPPPRSYQLGAKLHDETGGYYDRLTVVWSDASSTFVRVGSTVPMKWGCWVDGKFTTTSGWSSAGVR